MTKEAQKLTRLPDGDWRLGAELGPVFPTAADAVEFAERWEIPLVRDAVTFAYQLGGLVVEFSEGGHRRDAVDAALLDTLDSAWADAARDLAGQLATWAEYVTRTES